MKIIEPKRDRIVVGDKSLDAIEAEWRAWKPPRSVVPDVVPPEWINVRRYMEIRNCGEAQARKDLTRGVARGLAEVRLFRTLKSNGTPQNEAHYRLKG